MVARGITPEPPIWPEPPLRYHAGAGLVLALLWTPAAHAYIDGGTASMIFQMLIAGGLAAMLTLRSFWARVKSFFASLSRKTPPNQTSGSGRREA